MYILYGGGVTRALGPQLVLEEGSIPYELRIVDELKGEHRMPEYLALNPAGYIPTLVTPEGEVLHEAAAMMVYLAERHELDALIPRVGDPQRGIFFCKLFYHTNEIQPSTSRFYRPYRYSTDASHTKAIREKAREDAFDRWAVLDQFLEEHGPCHLGRRFSLVDLHMAMWAAYGLETTSDVIERFSAVRRCFEVTASRPKVHPLIESLQSAMRHWRAATKPEERPGLKRDQHDSDCRCATRTVATSQE